MGMIFKARSGNFSNSIGILLIRISLGSLFLFAGAKKILNLQEFIRSVQDTGQMGDTTAFILAFILPFMEMIFGGLYLIGLFTPVASFFIACMSMSFLFVLGFRHEELPFSYNIVFLAVSVATIFTGAGLISFDALVDKKKEPVKPLDINRESRTPPDPFINQKPNESDAIFVDEKDISPGKDVDG